MSRWPILPVKEHIFEVSKRKGDADAEMLSVTNNNGFVRSLDVFDKQVFSQDTSNYKLVRFNDIAYNPSRINVGSVARCHLPDGGAVSPMYVVVRCRDSLLPQYLLYFLKSDVGMQNINHRCVGAVRFQLRYIDLEQIELPIPPLPEQERVVRILDEAEHVRRLRVEADRRTADLVLALFYDMFGDPITNSKNLPVVPLGSLVSFRTGKLDSSAAVENGVYPFFTCSREDAKIDTYAFDCEALLLAGNNAAGEYSVKHYKGRFNAYQRTYVLNLLNVDHSYSFMQQALHLRLKELKQLSLGANTKFLTLGILKNIGIFLPNPLSQAEFAQRVSEIRGLEVEQAASRRRLDEFFQSLLHRAFQGEL